MSEIKVGRSTEEEAYGVWSDSPHSTVFTNPHVLKRIADKVHWYIARRGDEILCAWPICINNEGSSYIPPFCYYVGPLWAPKALEAPNHRILSLRIDVYEGFLELFEREYSGFTASLPIGIDDVRVFDWWNYHNKNKNRISISPRYTALINELKESTGVEKGYRQVRRYEIRQTEKAGHYVVDNDASLDEVWALYAQTMGRQDLAVSDGTKAAIEKVLRLAQDGYGAITSIRSSAENRRVLYVALTLRAKGKSNLVLNIADSDARNKGVSAYGIHNSIKRAIQLGDSVYDFNGANSPRRGDDKHSYGASAVLYFDIKYVRARQ